MSNEPGKAMPASNLSRFDVISASGDACVLDEEGHCITCSDEALAARVLFVDEKLGTAQVEMNGEIEEVDITLVEEVMAGSWLLVHSGVAIASMAGEASDG